MLLQALDDESTGLLVAESNEGRVFNIYVMGGEVLAAHSSSDDGRVLALLYSSNMLDADQVHILRGHLEQGKTLSEVLIGIVPDSLLMQVYFERFRDNLYQFLCSTRFIAFNEQDSVFVENIQVGHTSRDLIDELWATHTRIAQLLQEGELWLRRNNYDHATEYQKRLLVRCPEEVTLEDLCTRSPYEQNRTLELILTLIDEHILTPFYTDPLRDDPDTEE